MLFTYVKLREDETKLEKALKIIKKNKQEIAYFSPKQFKEYRKILEEENRTVSIVRNTKLKTVSSSERDKIFSEEYKSKHKNNDFLKVDNEYYHLFEERSRRTKGYLYIGDDKFIRLERKSLLFPIILLVFMLMTLPILFSPSNENNSSSNKPPIIDNTPSSDNDNDTPNQTEGIKFKGFKTAVVTKKSPYISLDNKSNSELGFVYQISEKIHIKVIEEFETYDEAKKYVINNSSVVENDYSSNDYSIKVNGKPSKFYYNYSINSVADNKYEVIETKYKIIYFTGAIKSGAAVNWNAYEMLSDTTDLHFVISAYNFDKQKYDTSMSFDATVVVK